MEDEELPLPDDLRCKRTDGKQWRCHRRVKERLKLCEIHHIQGRHRQFKQKVPESLKLQRKRRKKNLDRADLVLEKGLKIRAKNPEKISKLVKLAKPMKRRKVVDDSEALDGAVRKMKLKKGDLQLELIRMVLKRESEKRKRKEKEEEFQECNGSDCDGDLMRHLPNGVMAISSGTQLENAGPSSPSGSGSASGSGCCFNIKIGGPEADTVAITRRRFRSKNIEPLPVGTLQVLPYKRNAASLSGERRKKCHWCRRGGIRRLVLCSSCGQQFFCMNCIKEQYSVTREDVEMACPVCCGTCRCKDCLESNCTDTRRKESLSCKSKVSQLLYFHYLICMLLPVLKQINQDQSIELEVEAQIKGESPSDILIQLVGFGGSKQNCCNCKSFIVDFHRSCPKCSYKLCLSCCRDIFKGSLSESIRTLICKRSSKRKARRTRIQMPKKKSGSISKNKNRGSCFDSASLPGWKDADGSACMSCPPTEFGGCGDGLLDLQHAFPPNWIMELEMHAEEIVGSYELPEPCDALSACSLCHHGDEESDGMKQSQEAAMREDANDNFLYYPSVRDRHGDNIEHFQKHWRKAHPVIVRNVLQGTPDLSWDPVFLFCSYLKNTVTQPEKYGEGVESTSCLDRFEVCYHRKVSIVGVSERQHNAMDKWQVQEVEIGIKQLFMGSVAGQACSNICDERMKLKGWISSRIFQKHFPAHYKEVIHALPLPEYTDPKSELLNIAAKLPQESQLPDLGPSVSITYQSGEELMQADSVTKLSYDLCDVVNILVHATDTPVSARRLNDIRKLMKKKRSQDQKEPSSNSLDQKMENIIRENSSSHGENLEEVQFPSKLRKASLLSPSASSRGEADKSSFINRDTYHDKQDSSDSGVDSDCNSNSEPSGLKGKSIHNSGVSESQGLQQQRIESLRSLQPKSLSTSCGARWDVFRRQDVPKLMDYLRKHSNEFLHADGLKNQMVHPILDKNVFLDRNHKMRLKEEHKIEPWSFEQHVGEAVIIPAGCPYQIRNVKSCVNVVLDFLSPENVAECIQLADELRLLPEGHRAKAEKLEVKKMALHNISSAIKEIRELTCAETCSKLGE